MRGRGGNGTNSGHGGQGMGKATRRHAVSSGRYIIATTVSLAGMAKLPRIRVIHFSDLVPGMRYAVHISQRKLVLTFYWPPSRKCHTVYLYGSAGGMTGTKSPGNQSL